MPVLIGGKNVIIFIRYSFQNDIGFKFALKSTAVNLLSNPACNVALRWMYKAMWIEMAAEHTQMKFSAHIKVIDHRMQFQIPY